MLPEGSEVPLQTFRMDTSSFQSSSMQHTSPLSTKAGFLFVVVVVVVVVLPLHFMVFFVLFKSLKRLYCQICQPSLFIFLLQGFSFSSFCSCFVFWLKVVVSHRSTPSILIYIIRVHILS